MIALVFGDANSAMPEPITSWTSVTTHSDALDTDNVETFLSAIQSLSLTNYVSYHVTDEELAAFGLNGPELTIKIAYSTSNEDGNTEDSGTLLLRISRNPEEAAAYEEAIKKSEVIFPTSPAMCVSGSLRSFTRYPRTSMTN